MVLAKELFKLSTCSLKKIFFLSFPLILKVVNTPFVFHKSSKFISTLSCPWGIKTTLSELLSSKRIHIVKPKDTKWIADQTISTSTGTYVEVNEVCGYWDIDSGAVAYSSPFLHIS